MENSQVSSLIDPLVKRIIDVHGGPLWLELEGAGRGARLFFAPADKTTSKE